jgi:ubiquinone biosynthesis protein
MEFFQGALMTDYLHLLKNDADRLAAWLEENNINQRQVARRLHLSMLRQTLEDNLYHGDLHPGNIILLRNSRVALIDCGTVGFLELEYLQRFRMYLKALFELDYDKAADLTFLLAGSLPVKDLEPMKEELVRTLRAWGTRSFVRRLPYKEKSLVGIWQECNKVFLRNKCTFEWQILRILRTSTTLDASLSLLYPEINYTRLGRLYFRQAEQRALRNFATRKAVRQLLTNLMIATELPGKVSELMFFNTALARRHAKIFEGATTKAANMFAILFQNLTLLCILSGLVIVVTLLDRHAPTLVAPIMHGIIARTVHAAPAFATDTWILVLIIIAYVGWTFTKLRRRFSRKEDLVGGRFA